MAKKVSGQDNEEPVETKPVVALMTENFSNGDLNVLRDKINELIIAIS